MNDDPVDARRVKHLVDVLSVPAADVEVSMNVELIQPPVFVNVDHVFAVRSDDIQRAIDNATSLDDRRRRGNAGAAVAVIDCDGNRVNTAVGITVVACERIGKLVDR